MQKETPKKYQAWFDLLYASMNDPVNYRLNLKKAGVAIDVIINATGLSKEEIKKLK